MSCVSYMIPKMSGVLLSGSASTSQGGCMLNTFLSGVITYTVLDIYVYVYVFILTNFLP